MSTDCAFHAAQTLEVVVRRLLLLAGATLFLAACAESATAPTPSKTPVPKASHDTELECRSGYVVAYDQNGDPYCAPQ